MDIVVAGTQESIVMVEGASVEISEDDLVAALEVAHKAVQELIAIQHELVQMIGGPPQKFEYPPKAVSADFEAAVELRGRDPQAYIEDVLVRVSITPASEIASLTPWAWAKARKTAGVSPS